MLFLRLGLCNLYWRTFVLKPDQIALIPPDQIHRNRKQSMKALRWLEWCGTDDNRDIQHQRNGGEMKIGPYYVDGFDVATHTCYEFYGCL